MEKFKTKPHWCENMENIEAASSQVIRIGLAMKNPVERTLMVENQPFVQNPMKPRMDSPASDLEGNSHASFERESLLEFPYGVNILRPDKDICTGNEQMLGGTGSAQHLMDGMHKQNVNNPPFVLNQVTQPMKLPASGSEGNAQVSSEVWSLFEFSHGMKASSKPAEDTHAVNIPMLGVTKRMDTQLSLNILSPSTDPNLVNELSLNNKENAGMGLLTTVSYGDKPIKKVLPGGKYEDIIGKECPSSRDISRDRDETLLDERVVDIAKQLLLASNENTQVVKQLLLTSEENIQDGNPDCTINDISVEYLKLYHETKPENYDFAMNIMAHIEFLNDSSWTTTVSYLDENVKRIVSRIWNDLHITFNNTMHLQEFNRNMVLKLIMDFNQWSINKKFELELFLSYSILMCQLGVVARKSISEDAAFCAIYLLRERMKVLKFENLVQYMFDIALKDYAKRQCKV